LIENEAEAGAGGLGAAKERGFRKGLNVGLTAVNLCCALRAILWPFFDVPRHVEVFKQVKVPMPGLTLLVIDFYPFASIALFFGAVACCFATRAWGDQRRGIYVNLAYLLLCLGWIMVYSMAMGLPMLSLLEGIGHHGH
jgi:hypothetical protein